MMSEDNPYRAPTAPFEPDERRGPRPVGPWIVALVAVVLATLMAGLLGLLGALVGIGSWLVFRFWPRPPAPDVPELRAYLDRLEAWTPQGGMTAASDAPGPGELADDAAVFRDLRL
jgi:hypothetical protein